MLVFVYEYTCAACAWASLPASLRAEGLAMLAAVLADFRRIDGLRTATLLADDFPHRLADEERRTGADEAGAFRELAARADATLVIAPEFDDLLATRRAWVAAAGGRSLNADVAAVRLAGDKLALAGHLRDHGVPTPATRLAPWSVSTGGRLFPPAVTYPAVCKPRRGAGSQATFLLRSADDLPHAAAAAVKEAAGDAVVQPYHAGRPASVAFLVGDRQRVALPPASQHLSDDGRFRYLGGIVPLPDPLRTRAVELADKAVACVPGLRGYAGVDLLLGEPADGGGDVVIEINPRLTTSYIGLRRLARGNLAEAMLRVLDGRDVDLAWDDGPVRFRADGAVEG